MAYSTNPNLPKARAIAMQLLVRELLPVQVVANKCGVHRSTIYRWKLKWDLLNKYSVGWLCYPVLVQSNLWHPRITLICRCT